jgi:membrane protease YdiL (CAAX protease family)
MPPLLGASFLRIQSNSLSSFINEVLKDLGLGRCPDFIADRLFTTALIIGVVIWGILWLTLMPTFTLKNESIALILFTGVIWSPLLEEIFFRGVLQGFILKRPWGNSTILHLTKANWLTSFGFAIAHLWHQPIMWAILVFVPSLVYGFFRDRYNHTFPSILLHAFYNGGFILANLMAQ